MLNEPRWYQQVYFDVLPCVIIGVQHKAYTLVYICTQFATYARVVMSFIKIPLNQTYYNYRP
jgi:hypothetical protein